MSSVRVYIIGMGLFFSSSFLIYSGVFFFFFLGASGWVVGFVFYTRFFFCLG